MLADQQAVGPLVVGAAAPAPGPYRPRAGLPSSDAVNWWKSALELLLLLLAVPWLLRELARNPKGVSRRAARKHLGD